uniref:Uncharacterized protein n=1 Tax=Plectus sambesii TaxID=2011161 RepID=A0A914V4E0_9BILA
MGHWQRLFLRRYIPSNGQRHYKPAESWSATLKGNSSTPAQNDLLSWCDFEGTVPKAFVWKFFNTLQESKSAVKGEASGWRANVRLTSFIANQSATTPKGRTHSERLA